VNILPQSTQARREGLDGVPRLFMRHRARHQRAAAEALACAEWSTHPIHDAFATRAAAPVDQAGNAVPVAIPPPRHATPPIQSP
jgi:hypothetical protein